MVSLINLGRKRRTKTPILKKYIDEGIIESDMSIFHYKRKEEKTIQAKILSSGLIETKDGSLFNSLSSAAEYVEKCSVSGWIYWNYIDENRKKITLKKIRGL